MKGQSAIEYLMTYGWVILLVAVIAGAVVASGSDRPESETSEPEPRQGLPPHVEVFEYKEATCFMSNNIDGEGITCMPTSQVERGVAN